MARVSATVAPHGGIKTMPSYWQCRRCATDNIIADEVAKRGQSVFHGYSGSLPLECRSCGEQYLLSGYTIP